MRTGSSVAPVPAIDRALGAVITFGLTGFVGTFVAGIAFQTTGGSTEPLPIVAIGAAIGLAATVVLVFRNGYDRVLVAVEGRRWTVELLTGVGLFAGCLALIDLLPRLEFVFVIAALASSIYVGTYVGEAVADRLDWYDRDAYYREG